MLEVRTTSNEMSFADIVVGVELFVFFFFFLIKICVYLKFVSANLLHQTRQQNCVSTVVNLVVMIEIAAITL